MVLADSEELHLESPETDLKALLSETQERILHCYEGRPYTKVRGSLSISLGESDNPRWCCHNHAQDNNTWAPCAALSFSLQCEPACLLSFS